MSYSIISNFGQSAGMTPQNDPITYCALSGIDSAAVHTLGSDNSLLGSNNTQCQRFIANYCANKWDGVCEYMANDTQKTVPNMVSSCNMADGSCLGTGLGNALNNGQNLIRNAASERFLKAMSSNCSAVYESFDPTVADSPLIRKWMPSGDSCKGIGNCYASNQCIPVYDVDPETIDNDVVMNKILAQPWIAMDILVNIYNNRLNTGKLSELNSTKLGNFFSSSGFQRASKSSIYR